MENLPATVIYPESFRSSPSAGYDGVYDWSHWISAMGVLNRGIQPMDIDAAVEVNGYLIIAETKTEGVEIPFGQRRTLEALRQIGVFTEIRRWGKGPPGARVEFRTAYGHKEEHSDSVIQREHDFIERWALWADKMPWGSWRFRLIEFAMRNASTQTKKALAQLAADEANR
jgi:hypothetical protein